METTNTTNDLAFTYRRAMYGQADIRNRPAFVRTMARAIHLSIWDAIAP